jgi:hypothetical protein
MSFKTRLFVILLIAGFASILSFLFVDLSSLLATLPATANTKMPFSPLLVKLLGLIQPTVLLAVAVLLGVLLAPKCGLSAPAFEALARGNGFLGALRPQIIPGLIGGLVGGIAIILSWVLGRPLLPPEFADRAEQLNKVIPLTTRLFYGGVTEELLLRWGVLTLLVWAAWRPFRKARASHAGFTLSAQL